MSLPLVSCLQSSLASLRAVREVAVCGGKLYVSDFGNSRLVVLDSDSLQVLATLGHSKGCAEGQFDHPRGFAVEMTSAARGARTDDHDSPATIFVANSGNHCIDVLVST